jgi:DNA-binding PadR family transcriptional regulator
MSIRDAVLGILTLGPTYGHQVLFEIQTRLPHRATVNAGQVYSTITRLVGSGHIAPADVTAENLPTYQLTALGRNSAEEWLRGDSRINRDEWNEVMDVVLLACSLPHVKTKALLTSLLDNLMSAEELSDHPTSAQALMREAQHQHHAALAAWLIVVQQSVESGDFAAQGFSENRPGRGRRPSAGVRPND